MTARGLVGVCAGLRPLSNVASASSTAAATKALRFSPSIRIFPPEFYRTCRLLSSDAGAITDGKIGEKHEKPSPSPSPTPSHIPVLLTEVLNLWIPPDRGDGKPTLLVDGTAGFGGHTIAALRSRPSVRLLAIDRDPSALRALGERLSSGGDRPDGDDSSGDEGGCEDRVAFHRGSYAEIGSALRSAAAATPGFFPDGRADGILIDLGSNSDQLDDPSRGFSYRRDGPLDMRFDRTADRSVAPTAGDILADASEGELADLFRANDEPLARDIARAIVRWRKRRRNRRLTSTLELRHVIESAADKAAGGRTRLSKVDPSPIWVSDERGRTASHAKRERLLRKYGAIKPRYAGVLGRCFQALRAEVNSEADHLRDFLCAVPECVAPGGRLLVISFHPGEDAIVAEAMDGMVGDSGEFESLTEEPIRATKDEVRVNPRSRSAHLRAVMRIKG